MYEGERLRLSLRGSLTDESGGAAMQDLPVRGADGNPVAPDDIDSPGPTSNIVGREDTDFADASLRFDYEFPFGTLTSITAYADAGQDVYGDADFGPVDVVVQDLDSSPKSSTRNCGSRRVPTSPCAGLPAPFTRRETNSSTYSSPSLRIRRSIRT